MPRRLSHELISDDDRRAAVTELRRHCTDGRLTLDEFDERAGQAYEARTQADLVAVLRDLPELPPRPAVTRHAPPPAVAVAVSKADRSGFTPHLITYLAIMILLVGIWALTTPTGYFWPVWPALGWGVGLFAHAAGAASHRSRAIARR